MKLENLIREYLEKAKLMQIATANNNQPWTASVYFASDNNLNLYWISTPTRRHSEEIAQNQKVAGAIVLPHTPGDKVRGIQFQGIAKRLTEQSEIKHAMQIYSSRLGTKEKRVQNIIAGKDNHAAYQITPSIFVLFDEVNFPDNPRQQLTLNQNL